MDFRDLIMPGIIGGIFWVSGLYLLIRSGRLYRLQSQFREEGKTTTASITKVNYGNRNSPTTVFFTFVVDGQEHTSKQGFPKNFERIRQGDEIPLVYLEQNPKKHQLQVPDFNYASHYLRFVVFGGVTIILGCIAFWNLASPYFD